MKMSSTSEPVTIVDREILKVLSNDTRMDILKILSEGERNPSFVAKKLRKSDATIVEHLQTLEKAGLVKKTVSPGKKWVFYSLTEQGRGIVSSKSRRLVIILATSFIAFAGGAMSLGRYYAVWSQSFGAEAARAPLAGAEDIATTAVPLLQQPTTFLYVSAALSFVGVTLLGFYFYKKLKTKRMKI
jgi:DNA-binding transcriptional ArsR family regulator